MKRCIVCKKKLPDSHFYYRKDLDKLDNQCKKCSNKYSREYYHRNREKLQREQHSYYIKNRERLRKYHKEYKIKNKEKRKAYRQGHKNEIRAQARKYRQEHKTERRQYEKQHYNTEKGRAARYRSIAKRERNLRWRALFYNPFPKEIEVQYHHINNILTIPLPAMSHRLILGKNHKEKGSILIEEIYGIDINILLSEGKNGYPMSTV